MNHRFINHQFALWSMVMALLYFIPDCGYGQPVKQLFPLLKERNIVSFADTASINSLIKNANQYSFENPDSALVLFEDAGKLSTLSGYDEGLAEALMGAGLCYVYKGQNETGKNLIKSAKIYCQASSLKPQLMTKWYGNMAMPFSYMGQNDSAVAYLLKALTASGRDTSLLIQLNNNMGGILLNNNQFKSAIRYLKKAEQLALITSNEKMLPYIYNNIANGYNNRGDTSKLYWYAKKASYYSRINSDLRSQRISSALLGSYFLKIQKPEKAVDYFRESLRLCPDNNPSLKFSYLLGLGDAYRQLQKPKQALSNTLSALAIANQTDYRDLPYIHMYSRLADIYHDLNDNDNAFKYLAIYSQLNDSINNVKRNIALDKVEAKFRVAEKDKELAQKQLLLVRQQNNLRNRNIWIIVIVSIVLLIAGFFFNFYRSTRRKMYIMRQHEEINALQAMTHGEEQERTRVARELHDGIGGLLSAAAINLNTLADEHTDIRHDISYQKTETLIGEISKEVRKTAHNLMPHALLQYNLPDAIRLYCSYMVTKDEGLDIKIQTFGNFNTLGKDFLLILYRIVQELIQNILKHAAATTAFVQLHADSKLLSITVEDNGSGYEQKDTGSGLGLRNIATRVKSMNGKLSVDTAPGKGTSVYIEFDLDADKIQRFLTE